MTPRAEEIAAAAAHLQAMLDALYAGRSVRTTEEFRQDLQALQVAIAVLTGMA